MGRTDMITRVRDRGRPQLPNSSALSSLRLSVRTPFLVGQVTVQSRAPGSNRSVRR